MPKDCDTCAFCIPGGQLRYPATQDSPAGYWEDRCGLTMEEMDPDPGECPDKVETLQSVGRELGRRIADLQDEFEDEMREVFRQGIKNLRRILKK